MSKEPSDSSVPFAPAAEPGSADAIDKGVEVACRLAIHASTNRYDGRPIPVGEGS